VVVPVPDMPVPTARVPALADTVEHPVPAERTPMALRPVGSTPTLAGARAPGA
jgi:hypothetical protein